MVLDRAPDGSAKQVVICGLGKDGKGIVEVWTVNTGNTDETHVG